MSDEEKAVSTEVEAESEEAGRAEDETEKGDESATSTEEKREAPEESGEAEEKEAEKPKREGGFQRRIRKLAAQREAATAEAEYWRKRALAGGEPEKATAEAGARPKPKPDDFSDGQGNYDHARFADALAEWHADQRVTKALAEERERQRQAEAQTAQQRRGREFSIAEAKFAYANEDYDDVTDVALGVLREQPGSAANAVASAIVAAENGPELLYFLGQNPEELQRIAGFAPERALLALGALTARLAKKETSAEKGQETRTPLVSRAPKPPTPVTKPAGGVKPRPDDPETHHLLGEEDWLRMRESQLRDRAQRK